jgi:aminoglycoside phosphotransferase (APT) family kinase protein
VSKILWHRTPASGTTIALRNAALMTLWDDAAMMGRGRSRTDIDEGLIVGLLEEQAPHLAGLRAVKVRDGWDNAVWRLGDALAIRITRRAVAVDLHRHEQRWLPVLAPGLPLPVPAPVIVGVPSARFPWPWSVVPWFDGETAAVAPPLPAEARELARFLMALHVPAPGEVERNPARGCPLASCRASVTGWAQQPPTREDEPLIAEAVGVFNAGLLAATATERVWIHGDLHPRNVLVSQGRLCAVLDWGDVTAGDAAADLAALWWLFDLDVHDDFWSAYRQVSAATWHRARAWAALFGLSFLSFGLPGNPAIPDTGAHDLGRRQLRRVVAKQRAPRRTIWRYGGGSRNRPSGSGWR